MLDTAQYAVAMHDCDSGEWYLMPRQVAAALKSMTDSMTDAELAAWCGVPVAKIRRMRQ